MPYRSEFKEESGLVRARIAGAGDVDEFVSALRWLGAESVAWKSSLLLVDLTGVETVYSFTDQLTIGKAVGVNFRHLRKHAAVVRPERITRVGERAAQHEGSQVQVFADEAEALEWLRREPVP